MSVTNRPSGGDPRVPEAVLLIDRLVERENMKAAYARVVSNKGAAGVDRMDVSMLQGHLNKEWPRIKSELLAGTYRPDAVLQVEIPKPGGGMRKLGIPTVTDRLIQQGLLQILSPLFEPGFSAHSYGFRPGKSAAQAVEQAQEYVREGYAWVADMDLEKFFDEVPHDVLMGKIRSKITDKNVLKAIRKYLEVDVMVNGKREAKRKGPYRRRSSPLLANILLDDLDKELEKARPPVLPVRRRLQHLPQEREGRPTGEAIPDGLPMEAFKAEGKRGQERGGQGVAAQLPGVHIPSGQGPADSGCQEIHPTVQGQGEAGDASRQG